MSEVREEPSPITIQRTNYMPECKPDKWIVAREDPPHSTYHEDVDDALFMVRVMMQGQLQKERRGE